MLALLLAFLAGLLLPRVLPWVVRRCTQSRPKELYDDADALLLNLEKPQTRWFNMGFWTRGGNEPFAEAAAEHCRRVALAAQLKPGQRVLEVGYGSGDSTLLLAKEFSPSSYIGFTSLPGQQAFAAKRAEAADLSSPQFRLLQGDAARCLSALPPSSVDAVLAVDCAFHFSPRRAFLSSALPLLSPSPTSRLALSDLVLPPTPLSLLDTVLLRLLCLAANLPWGNMLTPAQYRARLVELGYDERSIEMEDISERVWPGFLEFVERRERELGGVLDKSKWGGLRAYAKVVRWYSGYGGGRSRLRFYLIAAGKTAGGAEEGKKQQ
ncbi:hypothetical protein JCM6882_009079 [Rhodosporidiobolus microsporus]